MDVTTGREFKHINLQDDPHLFPQLDRGFRYDHTGQIIGIPSIPNNRFTFPNDSLFNRNYLLDTNSSIRMENYKAEIDTLQAIKESLIIENKNLKEQITELKNKINNLK